MVGFQLRVLLLCVAPISAAPLGARDGVPERRYAAIRDSSALVGRYYFQEGELAIDVHLNADCTALYAVSADGGAGGIRAEGMWRTEGDRIHIYNRPGPARLDLVGPPVTNEGVRFEVIVTLRDGAPANGLGIVVPGSEGVNYMDGGVYRVERGEPSVRGVVEIWRISDGSVLARFDSDGGARNSRRFIYRPSEVEPFDIEAALLDPRGDVLDVEAGSASAPLRRVRDSGGRTRAIASNARTAVGSPTPVDGCRPAVPPPRR